MQKRRRRPDLLRIAALLVYFLLIIYAWLFIFMPRALPPVLRAFIPDERVNMLVMGLDNSFDERHRLVRKRRTDTMILVQIDPFLGKVNMLSIPRDSYVDIPGYGMYKINTAYFLGETKLAKKTVSNFLKTHVDKYLVINPDSFSRLIDGLGGIKIYVDKDMYYKDSWGSLSINLKKGLQKLNGSQAQGYIRFRHDTLGDITRIRRQQAFLRAVLRKASSPAGVVRMPWLIPTVKKTLKTDMSLGDIIKIGNFVRMINPSDIHSYSIPGNFSSAESPVSYWYPDSAKKDELVQQLRLW